MFRMIMNAIFRRRKARVFEIRRMPVGFELGDAVRARLAAERKAVR